MAVNNFDVLKRMAEENKSIQLCTTITQMNYSAKKGGTEVSIGVPGNVCFDFEYGDEAATAAAIASAPHVVRLTVESPRVAPVPMEPRAVLARFNQATAQYEIRCSHQGVGVMSQGLAGGASSRSWKTASASRRR